MIAKHVISVGLDILGSGFLCFFLFSACQNESQENPIDSFRDNRVEKILRDNPSINSGTDTDKVSRETLRSLGILTENLEILENIPGGCLNITVYNLSVSYKLIVDNNTCFGFDAYISRK